MNETLMGGKKYLIESESFLFHFHGLFLFSATPYPFAMILFFVFLSSVCWKDERAES